MNWLQQSIKYKFIAIIVIGALAIFIASLASRNATQNNISAYEELIKVDMNNGLKVNLMLNTFKTQVQEWKNTLLRGYDDKNREKYWGRFQQRQQEIQTIGSELKNTIADDEARNLISQFLSAHKTMGQAYQKGFNDFVAAGYDSKVGDKAVKGIDREPAKLLGQSVKIIEDKIYEHTELVSEKAHSQIDFYTLITDLVIVAFAIVALITINVAIVTPSRILISQLSKLAEGDLSSTIKIERQDELGQLADASRKLQSFLKNVADQLNTTNSQLRTASGDLSAATEGVSGRVASAHSSTEHIASAMTELSATAQEVSGHAANAASLANEADKAAKDGSNTMNTAQSSINNLAAQISETVSAVKKLEEDTNNVGTVLSVIRGIAEQTNLLALNAAIEAARAGEQGRGFAVVADEVRTLAQKTQQSTAEIEEIIVNVQNGAQNTVSVMDASSEITSQSAQLFNEANEKLNTITAIVSEINGLNMQVATAAEEQTSVAEDITRTVVEMSDLVEATAHSAEASLGTAQNLIDVASDVEKIAKTFS